MNQLIASSGSFEGIEKLISEYFCNSKITLKKNNDKTWNLLNSKGNEIGYIIIQKGKRFGLEEIIQ